MTARGQVLSPSSMFDSAKHGFKHHRIGLNLSLLLSLRLSQYSLGPRACWAPCSGFLLDVYILAHDLMSVAILALLSRMHSDHGLGSAGPVVPRGTAC